MKTFFSWVLGSCLLLQASLAPAQTAPPFQWVNTISGISDDVSECVKVDAFGNIYLSGFFSAPISFGNTNLAPLATVDAFVAKYDARGVCQWAVRPGGRGMTLDPAGNVIVTSGYSGNYSFGSFIATNAGGFDVYVVKYDNTGVLLWSRQYGSTQDERGTRAATDAAGNIYVAGEFASNISFGTNSFINQGAMDLFLLKFNPAGTLLWARQLGGSGNESNARVAVDSAGNALMTGAFQGNALIGTNLLTSLGASDIFVAKYDPNGSVLWARQAGGPGDDLGNELTTDPAGNVFVTGEFVGVATFGTTNLSGLGGADAFVAKYDPAGTLVHVWHIGTSGEDRGRGVGLDAAGNIYLHGDFTGVLNVGPLSVANDSGSRDVFVLKMDGAGSPLWLKRAGSPGTDTSGNLAVASNGDVFLSGSSSNTISFDNLSFTNAGANDVYFTKIPANPGPLPVPAGLVGWWAAEGYAVDYAWTNHGTFTNAATIAAIGKVGSAFSFDGTTSAVLTSTNALKSPYSALTVEAWVFPTNHSSGTIYGRTVIGHTDGDGFALRLNSGVIQVDLRLTSGDVLANFGPILPLDVWSHIAYTYDGTRVTAYLNGIPQGFVAASGTVRNSANASCRIIIGHEASTSSVIDVDQRFAWAGLLDEISVYSRALAPTEMQSVFTADTFGKARPAAPTILVQPPALTVVDQSTPVSLGVAAAGYAPLAYQWRLNGTNLPGQTNFSISIPAAYSIHEGTYDVRITQLDSVATNSMPAVLNVLGQGDARTLFGVTNDVANFIKVGGGAVPWTLTSSNTILVVPNSGSIQTTQSFGDFILHAEFRTPNPTDLANGNSGIYLQNRYEIQIFNSFGVSVPGLNDAGAVWGQRTPSVNAALPAGQWQTYDITFHQAQWNRNTKFANARVTVVLNGVTVQNDVALTGPTTGGAAEGPTPGPIVLQDNGSSVQFRNVRITPLDTPPEFTWARRSGSPNAAGTNNDFVKGTKVDANGNVYVTGSFSGTADFGSTNITSAGSQDFFLAKYDPAGTLLWVAQGGGAGSDQGLGLTLDPAGSPIVSGDIGGSATFGTNVLTGLGASDIFVAKFTPAGQLLWIRTAGGPGTDHGHGVVTDGSGNVFLVGGFSGTASFGAFNLTDLGTRDVCIVKFDSAGNVVWARRAGSAAGLDDGYEAVPDGAGGIFLTGTIAGNADFGAINLTATGSTEAFVAHYDAGGNVIMAVCSAGSGNKEGYSLARDPSGNLLLSGSFTGTAIFGADTLRSAGNGDVFLAKLDSTGTFLWARQGGGANDDESFFGKVAVDGNGNAFIAGAVGGTATFNTTTLSGMGNDDVFIGKYDPAGNLVWVQHAGGNNYDYSRGLAVDPAGTVYVGGTFTATAQFGQFSLTSVGAGDMFVGKIGFVPPAITLQPVGGSVLAGQNLTLAIVATGTGGVTYQWRFNGTNITGATNTTYTIPNVTTNAAGTYDVLVTHVYGTATSAPAVVTVVNSLNPLSFVWARRAGGSIAAGNNNDFGKGMKVDAAGNVYVTGNFSSVADFGATNVTSAGNVDFYLAKYDPAGTLLWVATGGGAGFDEGLDIALDPAGNPVVTGIMVGPATFDTNVLAGFGGQDVFVAKFTTNGQLAWIQSFGGPGLDNGAGVTVDTAGNIFVTGVFNQTATFGANAVTSAGAGDVFLVRLDAAGVIQWVRQAGGAGNDTGWGLAADGTGGVYLDGFIGSAAFLSRYDSTGNPLWTVQSTGSGTAAANGLARDGAGNLLLRGNFSGSVAFGTNSLNGVGGTDIFLAKLDTNGVCLWARQAGGLADDDTFSSGRIVVDAFGNAYISGGIGGDATFGNTAVTGYGSNDVFIAKYDKAGNFLWVEQAGGGGYDYSRALDVDASGNVLVTGSFHGNALFTPLTLTSAGAGDVFVAKLGAVPPVITTQPVSQTISISQGITFAVAATGTPPFAYQWRYNGTNLPGATNVSFSIPAVIPPNAGTYSVLVGDALGITASSNATLTVDTSGVPFITTQPQSQTVPQGSAVLLTVDALGAQPIGYQWRKNGTNLVGQNLFFLALNGTTTNSSGTYTVVLNNSFGSVTSAPAVLTVIQVFPPVITNQPASLTVREGSNATFSVAASGTAPFNYQWVRGGNAIPNNDSPTLTITNATLADTDTYFVQIFNSAGLATSQPATLTVQAPPVFLSMPQPVSVLQGGTTNFSATASGVPAPAYSWYKDGVRLISSPTYSGVITTNLLVLGVQAGQVGNYVVVATNVAGAITSAPVTLTVLFAPTITTHPTNVTLLRTNSADIIPVMLSVAASGAPPLLYQWRFNSVDLAGETNTTLTLTNVTRLSNGLYQAVVTNLAGSAASSNALVRVRVPQRVEPPVFVPGAPFRLRFTDDNGEQAGPVDMAKIEVQAAATLLGTNTAWVKLTNGFSVVNGMLQFDDPSVTNLVRRYYRVIEK